MSGGGPYSRQKILQGLAYLDAASILIFLAVVLWLAKAQRAEEEVIKGLACTAADYTVKVTNLPR